MRDIKITGDVLMDDFNTRPLTREEQIELMAHLIFKKDRNHWSEGLISKSLPVVDRMRVAARGIAYKISGRRMSWAFINRCRYAARTESN